MDGPDPTAALRLAQHVLGRALAVVEWDAEFRVVGVSQRAEELFGWTAGELIGRRVDEIPWVTPDAWPSVRAAMRDLARGASPSNVTATRNLRKDGTALSCDWYSSAIHDASGRLSSVLSLVLDVTDRERAEAALRESRGQLALFVEHAPAAIAMLDRELRYLAVSQRYLCDYKIEGQEVVGRGHYEVFPEISERWRAIHQRCLAGAVEKSDGDPFPRADGRTDWVRWEIRPWRDAAGAVGGLILLSEVITEQREMEQRAARAERLEAIATLVRGMSHEINNPLASAITNVEYVRDELRAAPPSVAAAWSATGRDVLAEVREALEDAAQAADRVKGIVRDLAGFLPRPAGSTGRSSLRAAADQALRLARHELVSCAEVSVDLADERDLPIEEDDLVQVLASLLVNAGQATGALPNRVRIASRPLSPDRVAIDVSDTGVGMDEAVLAHVFEPFFTTRPTGRGKGLGVARCRGIVERAGGELGFRSQPGRGTTATLVLPLVAATEPREGA
jgi:PAS domain S-box-containing protein